MMSQNQGRWSPVLLVILSAVLFTINVRPVFGAKYTREDDTYVAAVCDFHLSLVGSFTYNLKVMLKYIATLHAMRLDVDILVFPENALVGNHPIIGRNQLIKWASVVPDSGDKVIPCLAPHSQYSEAIRNLSCAARDAEMYLVVNLPEKVPDNDATLLYNANVVFDRQGTVISRYRKFHLFGEFMYNVTETPDIATFSTDFGVTFGMFTCFDILYSEPGLHLTRQLGLTDIIFPTRWMSELPFLTAIQIQESWAHANQVNVLAANINQPRWGSTGSGIYQSGYSATVITGLDMYNLLVIDVVKRDRLGLFNTTLAPAKLVQFPSDVIRPVNIENHPSQLDRIVMVPYDITGFNSELIAHSAGTQSFQLCYESFCCTCSITLSISSVDDDSKDFYRYRFVAFDGVRSFSGMADGGIRTCGVVACLNETLASCGQRFESYNDTEWPVRFDKIKITGDFRESPDTLNFPNTLNSELISLPQSNWTYDRTRYDKVVFTLTQPTDQILTFAIYGRNFSRDNEPKTKSAAVHFSFQDSKTMLMMAIVLGLALFH